MFHIRRWSVLLIREEIKQSVESWGTGVQCGGGEVRVSLMGIWHLSTQEGNKEVGVRVPAGQISGRREEPGRFRRRLG